MARRLREFTFTVSLGENTIREPYVAYTIEVDLDDGSVATLSPSGARPWATMPPELVKGLRALVRQVVSEMKAEPLTLRTGEEKTNDVRASA